MLLDAIFFISDIEGKGFIDIRSICANILIHMKCDVIVKMQLLFDILIDKDNILNRMLTVNNMFLEKSKIIDII